MSTLSTVPRATSGPHQRARPSFRGGAAPLLQRSPKTERPVDENRLSVNVVAADRAPGAAVVRRFAMVAEHVVVVGLDVNGRITLMVEGLGRNIRFRQSPAVDVDAAVLD